MARRSVQGGMRTVAVASLAAFALAGCQPLGVAEHPQQADPDGPHLRTASAIFDPVADDVPGTEACDGVAGREELEVFDRAAWPDLDVPAGDAVLTCGNADGAGWRHIADGHTDDFGDLADEVDASWEDVAWFAIDQALEAPTAVEEYRSDIVNYDVRVELVGDTGEVERAWIVTVGYGLSSSSIITSFPDEVDP